MSAATTREIAKTYVAGMPEGVYAVAISGGEFPAEQHYCGNDHRSLDLAKRTARRLRNAYGVAHVVTVRAAR